MRLKIILEEYNPEVIYIQGSKNIAHDASSRLDIVDTNNPINCYLSSFAEYLSLENEDVPHPVNYKTIMYYHHNNKF